MAIAVRPRFFVAKSISNTGVYADSLAENFQLPENRFSGENAHQKRPNPFFFSDFSLGVRGVAITPIIANPILVLRFPFDSPRERFCAGSKGRRKVGVGFLWCRLWCKPMTQIQPILVIFSPPRHPMVVTLWRKLFRG